MNRRWRTRAQDVRPGEAVLASSRLASDDQEIVDEGERGEVSAVLDGGDFFEEDAGLVVLQVEIESGSTRYWRYRPGAWVELPNHQTFQSIA